MDNENDMSGLTNGAGRWLRWIAGGVLACIGAWLVALSSAYFVLSRETPTREEIAETLRVHGQAPHEGAVRTADYRADQDDIRRRLGRMEDNLTRLMVAQGVPPVPRVGGDR